MKKSSIWKFTASAALLFALGACSNSSSADDFDDYDDTPVTPTSNSSKKSSSSAGYINCNTLKESLAAPTNFSVSKDTDSSWTLSWDYSRNDARPESRFEVQSLDMETSSPEWESEGTTNADVTIYKLKGEDKAGKYYRIVATDRCGVSRESNRVQIKSDGYSAVDTGTVEKVDMPTDLAIARIAPSIWELSWKYSDMKDDPNRVFIIQTSKLKDFKWTTIKKADGKDAKIKGNVRSYYIQGRDKIESYYRMAVVNSGDTSAFTEAIQLTPDIPYREYMALDVPVPSTNFTTVFITSLETDRDTSTKDDITFVGGSATYTITEKFISKYIYESEYTDTVYYEARWFTSLENYNFYKGTCEGKKKSDKCDSCYWEETFPYQEPAISKSISVDDFSAADKKTTIFGSCTASTGYVAADHPKLYDPDTSASHRAEWAKIMEREINMSICLQSYLRKICGYYVQLRIVWKDKNGETDWSEWTTPFNVGEIASGICGDDT